MNNLPIEVDLYVCEYMVVRGIISRALCNKASFAYFRENPDLLYYVLKRINIRDNWVCLLCWEGNLLTDNMCCLCGSSKEER